MVNQDYQTDVAASDCSHITIVGMKFGFSMKREKKMYINIGVLKRKRVEIDCVRRIFSSPCLALKDA